MALKTEFDAVAFQQAGLIAAVGQVAGAAVKLTDRGMQMGRLLHAGGKILVAIKAQFFQRHFKQPLLVGTVRVMAYGAGPGGGRAMLVPAVEPLLLMALKTEEAALCRRGKILSCRGRMLLVNLLMAGQTVVPVNRGMDKLFRPDGIMTAVGQAVVSPAVVYPGGESQHRAHGKDMKKKGKKANSLYGCALMIK